MACLVLKQLLVVSKVSSTVRADVDRVTMLCLGVLSYQISLVSFKATAYNPALKFGPHLTTMNGLFVHIKLLVGDKVHVALGAPITGLFRRQMSFSDMNFSVFERKELKITADTLVLAAQHQGGDSPAGA